MTPSQAELRAALLDAARPVPDGLLDGHDAPAGKRFFVYRNNVVASLTEALRVAFPLLRKLLGDATFDRLAAVFLQSHLPETPLLMYYGAAMPDFLRGFEPLQHIGYLPDCAALDLALRQSYHAADAAPVDPARLSDPDTLATMTFALAPSSRLLRSPWPLHDIWRYNVEANAPEPRAEAQDVLITRPDFDPEPHLLPPGAALWLELLDRGIRFGEATDEIIESVPQFDLEQALTLVLRTLALIERPEKES